MDQENEKRPTDRSRDHAASGENESRRRVAVIGAGIAGLSASRALVDAGHTVTCFDKSRGVGGRTSTRRAAGTTFDHGAQYFTARDSSFRRTVDSWLEAGVAAAFEGSITTLGTQRSGSAETPDRFVGVPGMNSLAKHMAEDIDVRLKSRVACVERSGDAWTLLMEEGEPCGVFDAVLVTTPPAQAAPLVSASPMLASVAVSVEMQPCWALMVVFAEGVDVPFAGAFVNGGPLGWICRNGAKAGRPPGHAWVLHATPEWTRQHISMERTDVETALLGAFKDAIGIDPPDATHVDAHRWMFSIPDEPRADGAAYDEALGLGLAGDWLMGSKVQGAWLSGRALAERVVDAYS